MHASRRAHAPHWLESPDPASKPKSESVEWQKPVSGLWSNAARWSGHAVPGSDSLVTIAQPGHYTITIAASAVAESIMLDDSRANLVAAADLSVDGTIDVAAGTFTVGAGGTVTGATLASAAPGTIVLSSGATLSGVTYDGLLSLATAAQTLTINKGLTLTGANGSGPGTLSITGNDAALVVQDSMTLNNATLDIGYVQHSAITLDDPNNGPSQTLTLGPSLDLVLGNGPAAITTSDSTSETTVVINQGTIDAAKSPNGYGQALDIGTYYGAPTFSSFVNTGNILVSGGSTVSIYAGELTNTGTILVSGGTLTYGGYTTGLWTNAGAISVTNGSLNLDGTFTSATFNSISLDQSGVTIDGTLLNSGTLSLPQFNARVGTGLGLGYGGVISGGVISDPDNTLGVSSGTFSGVTFQGTITLYDGLSIANGITLEGAGGAGEATVTVTDGYIAIGDNETLNNATLTLGLADSPSFSTGIFLDGPATQSQTLTLGPALQLTTTNGCFISGDSDTADAVINEGAFVSSAGSLQIGALASFANLGNFTIATGGTVTIESDFINSGSVTVDGTHALLDLDGDWANTGQIAVDRGTLDLGGTFTLGAVAAITNKGGQVVLTGQLDNAGTLTVNNSLPFSIGDFEATIQGGVVADTDGLLGLYGATLSGVAYLGTLSLTGNESATIRGGIKLETDSYGRQGAVTIKGQGMLTIADSETLSDATISLGGDGQIVLGDQSNSVAQTLQIGSSLVLDGGGYSGISGEGVLAADLANHGTIATMGTGADFGVGGNIASITNAGTISATQSGTIGISVNQMIRNTGLISATGTGSALNDGNAGSDTTGLSNAGKIAVSAGASFQFYDGSFTNTGDILVTGDGSAFADLDDTNLRDGIATNSGNLIVNDGAIASIVMGSLTNTGTIDVSGSNSMLSLQANWTNDGDITVRAGTLDLGGTFTTATLETVHDLGGVIRMDGDLENAGATLTIGQGSAFGTFKLNGTINGGSVNEVGSGVSILYLADLMGVAFNGTISVGAATTLYDTGTQTGSLTNAGTLLVDGGTLTVNGILASTGIVAIGYGGSELVLNQGATLANVTDNGAIDAAAGTTTISSEVLGTGTLQVGGGASLILSAGLGEQDQLNFLGTTGNLGLLNPSDFMASIAGFAGSDTIDLVNIQANDIFYQGGILSILENNEAVAYLRLQGAYYEGDFSLSSDGHGGTFISYHG
jgi:hypothetical protein